MKYKSYYILLVRKGPNWTDRDSIEMEYLEKQHTAHLDSLLRAGMLSIYGPVEGVSPTQVVGMAIFHREAFHTDEELISLIEADPLVQLGYVIPEYLNWYVPDDVQLP